MERLNSLLQKTKIASKELAKLSEEKKTLTEELNKRLFFTINKPIFKINRE